MFGGWIDFGKTNATVLAQENGQRHKPGGWRADFYDYARWEYGTEDAAEWLLREAEPGNPGKSSSSLLVRLRGFLRLGVRNVGTTTNPPSGSAPHVPHVSVDFLEVSPASSLPKEERSR